MKQAKPGDKVTVHYTGKLTDGTVFDSSEGREPLAFELGSSQVIAGFDKAVSGLSVGKKVSVTIPAAEAYGEIRDDLIQTVKRNDLPPDLQPKPGQQLQAQQEDGSQIIVTITDVTDTTVDLDANHPLAGQDLVFDIELVEIG